MRMVLSSRVALAAWIVWSGLAAAAPQEGPPTAFTALVGEWRGEGSLMGRPARFEMSWEPALGGRFVRLDFSNAFVVEGSDETTLVLTAVAYYRPGADGATAAGTWFDTRGLTLPLQSTLSATELVTVWGDPDSAERGRTTYRILGPDRVEVIDEVAGDDGYGVFGRATYRRVPSSDGGSQPGGSSNSG